MLTHTHTHTHTHTRTHTGNRDELIKKQRSGNTGRQGRWDVDTALAPGKDSHIRDNVQKVL